MPRAGQTISFCVGESACTVGGHARSRTEALECCDAVGLEESVSDAADSAAKVGTRTRGAYTTYTYLQLYREELEMSSTFRSW